MKKIIEHIQAEWYKYLIELLVLIVGIYGAFTLESWGDMANRRKQEISMLKNLQNSLQLDTADLNFNLDRNKQILTSQYIVLDFLDNKVPYHDSLSAHLGVAISGTLFVSNEGAFETLKSVGVDLISNEKLLEKLVSLYDTRYDYYIKLDNQYIDIFYQFIPYNAPHFKEWNTIKMEPIDSKALQSDTKFRYYMGTLAQLNEKFLIPLIVESLNDAEDLLQSIDQELKTIEK